MKEDKRVIYLKGARPQNVIEFRKEGKLPKNPFMLPLERRTYQENYSALEDKKLKLIKE